MFTTKSYTLEKKGVEYPSLRSLYMSYDDPTEYQFATEILGGWEHWEVLSTSFQLAPLVVKWKEEMEIKLRSTAIRAIYDTAKTAGSSGTTAAKFIADKGWEKTRGRPSKEEVAKERKIHAGIEAELDDDADRIGLH